MTQVQVLPYVPSFGERLGQVIPEAGANLFQGYLQGKQNRADQQVLQDLVSNPNLTPLQVIAQAGRLSPKSQASLSPLFSHFVTAQQNQLAKQQSAQQEASQEHEEVSETINSLADELMEGRVGKFNQYNKLTSKGRESRAYFDELALAIEKRLANMVGKGALSKARFDYLKKNLPSSDETDATNRGKLRALAKEFKVDIQNPSFKKEAKSAEREVEGKERASLEDIFK